MKNYIVIFCFILLILASCGNPNPWGDNEKYISLFSKIDSTPTFLNWSPNGQQLLLTNISSSRNNSSLVIYEIQGGMRLLVQTDWGLFIGCGWSPDGEKILVSSFDNSPAYRDGIWIFSSNSNGQPEFVAEGHTAAWSSQGNTIAVIGMPKVIGSSIWETTLFLHHLDTGLNEVVTTLSGQYFQIDRVSWSPTEEKLVYSYQQGDDTGKILHNTGTIDLSTKLIVTLPDARRYDSSWSPEGNMIASVIYGTDNNVNGIIEPVLAISNSDGSCTKKLIEDVGAIAWAPDGQIAFAQGNNRIFLLDVQALLGLDSLSRGLACP